MQKLYKVLITIAIMLTVYFLSFAIGPLPAVLIVGASVWLYEKLSPANDKNTDSPKQVSKYVMVHTVDNKSDTYTLRWWLDTALPLAILIGLCILNCLAVIFKS
ncbi:hypothetical protein ACFBZI_10490 [Moraxella sp. ZJ142]|uniref:hypothetical protein n=1 Tax=Moraxella marmotae TaxID=3344520 RepID=UPI0035D45E0B